MVQIGLACFMLSAVMHSDAARILAVFPVPSISHQVVFRPLTQELARRGHDVVVITTDPAFPRGEAPENLTEIDVHDISYAVWHKQLLTLGKDTNVANQFMVFIHFFSLIVGQQLLSKEVQDIIKQKNIHFDLILAEACARPSLIFSHIFKAPVIQVSSFGPMVGMNDIVGAPNHPLYQPIIIRQRVYNLTLWERFHEIYQQWRLERMYHKHEDEENEMLKEILGPNIPTISELYENVDMVLINVHPIWIDNQPVPSGVIYMGGIHQITPKELPMELKSYLDSSKNGVIYMSFGSNVQPSVIPPQKLKIMLKVFSALPYDVIFKWDVDIPDKPSNVKLQKWLPQSDLLRHPNIKLFITQGGLQSTDEAITAGVPLIGIPVLADQWYNSEKYILHGIGLKLEMGTFTEEDFKNAIVTVISNPRYRDNIVRLRALMRDQPESPLQRAVWWVEHALRHGGARHLRAPAANMTWTRYYQLDLVLFVLACLLCIIIFLSMSLYYVYKFVLRLLHPSAKSKIS